MIALNKDIIDKELLCDIADRIGVRRGVKEMFANA